MNENERIANMSPTEVLLFFISSTRPFLRAVESAELVELLAIYRAFIIGGYREEGLEVPLRLAPVWARCLKRLRRYIGTGEGEAGV